MLDPLFCSVVAVAALLCAWAAKHDLQFPIALTLATFAVLATAVGMIFGSEFAPVAALVATCLLIAEADRRDHLIPDPMVLAVLLLSFAMPFGDDVALRVIGATALGATFLFIRQAVSLRRGIEALGWGDVKLAAAMGAVLGPIYGFAAVAIAGMATLMVLAAIQAKGGAVTAGAPFGIGLAAATAALAVARAMAL